MKVPALPTLATLGNLSAGFAALLLALQHDFGLAAALVGVAALFDAVDGAVARLKNCEGEFGRNLDSLADLVSFGAAPALALYLGPFDALNGAGSAVCLCYLACGAFRLARFPLVSNASCFVGLPVPPAGVFVSLLVAVGVSPVPAAAAAVSLGALMVSTLRFPTLGALLPKHKPGGAEGGESSHE